MKYRQSLVCYALKYGITKAPMKYGRASSTICFWLSRYGGMIGSLACRSKRLHCHPNGHTGAELKRIGYAAEEFRAGPDCDLNCAAEAIPAFPKARIECSNEWAEEQECFAPVSVQMPKPCELVNSGVLIQLLTVWKAGLGINLTSIRTRCTGQVVCS